MLILSGCWYL